MCRFDFPFLCGIMWFDECGARERRTGFIDSVIIMNLALNWNCNFCEDGTIRES